MARFTWRTQYDELVDNEISDRARTVNNEPTLTQQHHAEQADINNIVASFGITDGAIPPVALDPRYFGDFSSVPDFREALDATREAQARFDALPAELRSRFGHSPVALYEFVMNPANTEEAVKLGLLKTGTVVNGVATPPAPPSTTGTVVSPST